eukprot:CAMPEP_0114635226 /NCGR_PEP_ID=MMETSP0168-20121206/16376_1 /TAXON_ID=95228 ORGANISM="Vannella sp., Strain DIVA3 517/6/12" /NCGR_SAMPLE_ID=MMETSP0168 /ASSEMBLY_ACC=CAM_ASM_000044 /LENGTH=176 /DNA_ID=CAMNT_0001846931 /DNA_START=158 /DNA_END=688 /DNA_ORIENTATION=-
MGNKQAVVPACLHDVGVPKGLRVPVDHLNQRLQFLRLARVAEHLHDDYSTLAQACAQACDELCLSHEGRGHVVHSSQVDDDGVIFSPLALVLHNEVLCIVHKHSPSSWSTYVSWLGKAEVAVMLYYRFAQLHHVHSPFRNVVVHHRRHCPQHENIGLLSAVHQMGREGCEQHQDGT